MAQHPLKQDSVEVAYYTNKLDSLKTKVVAQTKDEKTALSEQISTTTNTLNEKTKLMNDHKAQVKNMEKEYAPIKKNWDNINAENNGNKTKFWVIAIITFFVFILKTWCFAHWNAKNSKNLHNIADYMKNGMPAWLSYVAWFVPVYNFLKPLSFFKEIWEETDYILENKGIITRDENKIDNSGLYLSIWWTLLLISFWLMNFILYNTFFSEGVLFQKTNHSFIAIMAIVIMAICMVIESLILLAYNKKNKMLVDNEDKF